MSDAVIATGGGFVLDKDNINKLKKNSTVFNLKTNPEIIKDRLGNAKATRPLLQEDFDEVIKRFSDREEFYKNCDEEIILELNKAPEFYVEQIINRLQGKDR
jgi:shikimate kinase